MAQHQNTGSSRSIEGFIEAQRHVLDRYQIEAESLFVRLPVLDGDAHVLVAGKGPPVVMVIGGGMVAGLWAPLMAQLRGFTLYAVDPPGHGLTAPMEYRTETIRSRASQFLAQMLDGLELQSAPFVSQSMGGLWTTWLALDRTERVASISYVACPAMLLGTSAPTMLRISTIRFIRRLLQTFDPPSAAQVRRMTRRAGEDLTDLPELSDLFLAHERMPGMASSLLDLHRAVVRVRGSRPAVRLTESHMSAVTQPVQMIWGEHDPFGPPSVGRRVTEITSRAQLHVVPGGHGPWFHHSEIVGPLIDGFTRLNG